MELSIESHANALMQDNHVDGVLVADKNGLCMMAIGAGNSDDAGSFVKMHRTLTTGKSDESNSGAEGQEGGKGEDYMGDSSVVAIKSKDRTVLLTEMDGYTIAIYKANT